MKKAIPEGFPQQSLPFILIPNTTVSLLDLAMQAAVPRLLPSTLDARKVSAY